MSEAEILAELPKLKAHERDQIFRRLCELRDEELIRGGGASDAEREALDQALAEFHRDGDRGTDWRTVLHRVRSSRAR